MTTATALFPTAFAHHQDGRLVEAVALYERILALDPVHADSLHLLGVALHGLGQSERAEALIGRAIACNPSVAAFHNNLGAILADLGRAEPALEAYRAALRLQPDYPDAQVNLANLLLRLGRTDEALACVEAALRYAPDRVDLLLSRGNLLYRLGRLDAAEAAFRAVLALDPALVPALSNLGLVLTELGRFAEAEAACRAALAAAPLHAGAQLHLGMALYGQGRLEPAGQAFAAALAAQPGSLEALTNLGAVARDLGRLDEAVAFSRRAVAVRPDFAEAHNNLALALLSKGEYREGWAEYEWRWRVKALASVPRVLPQPLWRGETRPEARVLIHAEQGLGDTLQFCRFLPLAAARARILFEAPPALRRILAGLPGIEIITAGDPLPAFDFHCPLMSLPHRLGTVLETIPAEIPYLAAPSDQVAAWRARRRGTAGLWVGLVWAGAARPFQPRANLLDRRRSLRLDQLAPLAAVPGVTFVSLQKGEAALQLATPPPGIIIKDWSDELQDFADTAALIEALDLVITVDTSVVHLAGALGKPVWLLNRFDACWRWLAGRDDSPWYPTLRQFRQQRPGDWAGVVALLCDALAAEAGAPARSGDGAGIDRGY